MLIAGSGRQNRAAVAGRALFSDAQALQRLAGTAPVSFQSGQIHRVHLRQQCSKSLRNAVHLWANLSREFSPWAVTYYTALRAKGKSNACALRALGQRWLKIVWKMWQKRKHHKFAIFHSAPFQNSA